MMCKTAPSFADLAAASPDWSGALAKIGAATDDAFLPVPSSGTPGAGALDNFFAAFGDDWN